MTKRTKEPRLFKEMDERERYERDLFTAICTACGYPLGQLTKTARGRVQRAVKELAEITATADQVEVVAQGLRAEYKTDGVVTPQGITGNWPKFVGGTASDGRMKKEREAQQEEDSKTRAQIKVALAMPSDQFDDLRDLLLKRDRGIMHKYLAEEPATKNSYLLSEMGRFLGAQTKS